MLIYLLGGALLLVLWYVLNWPTNYYNRIGVKQTKPWPIFGDSFKIILRLISLGDFVFNIYNLYDDCRYIGFYQLNKPTLILKDPELIKQITIKDFEHFTDHRTFINPEADPLWSNNLFALTGQKWREMRATLSGSFTSNKMKHMFEVINETAENFAKHFMEKKENLLELEMKDTYCRFTNDVIATAAFGIKVDSLGELDNKFYILGKNLASFGGIWKSLKFFLYVVFPRISGYLNITIFDKDTTEYFRNAIIETIKMREEKHIKRKDMIDLLLEARKGHKIEEANVIETGFSTVKEDTYFDKYKFKQTKYLSDDDITAQALIFFFAGFDTISTALCYGSHELAMHKNIQDKLREEIRQTHKLNNGKLTYENLLKMKYMDMVFSEVLRKWPPGFVVDRLCTKQYTIEPKYSDESSVTLKVGDTIWIPIYGLHRDPNYYPDPDKFDPERFSDENKDEIKPYTYLPFGSGPRNCIGSRFAILEAKCLLYNLLLNFEIVPIKKTRYCLKFAKAFFQNTVEGGFWLGLKRLNF